MTEGDFDILVVEDEEHMVATIQFVLGTRYSLRVARTAAEAKEQAADHTPDLILLDLGLPDQPGDKLLRDLRRGGCTRMDVIMVTGSSDVGAAVEVMKLNASDYVAKPFEREDLLLAVQKAYERWELKSEAERLRQELYRPYHFENIIARSVPMMSILDVTRKMCVSEATVLVTGESGTGKELIAGAIHSNGTRRNGPFIEMNCAQFSGSLLESELFGHERGAFTGAVTQRKGRFELADGGTLFLDEVGNTSAEMQSKILRIVETGRFERVGGEKSVSVDVRLIAATNANLEKEVAEGRFREDLFYRLNVVRIRVPPLRDRSDDIPILCDHLLAKHAAKTGRNIEGVTPEAMEALCAYTWRGNVRELENILQMAIALEDGDWVTLRYLPDYVRVARLQEITEGSDSTSVYDQFTSECQRFFLAEQLRLNDWNQRETARKLGIHRNTLERTMKRLGIERQEGDL